MKEDDEEGNPVDEDDYDGEIEEVDIEEDNGDDETSITDFYGDEFYYWETKRTHSNFLCSLFEIILHNMLSLSDVKYLLK